MSRNRARRRSLHEEEPTGHNRWLLSFADFVTLLLAVFVLLAATAWQKRPFMSVSSAIQSEFKPSSPGGARPHDQVQNPPAAAPAKPHLEPALKPSPDAPKASDLKAELQSALGTSIDKQEIVLQQRPEGLVITLRELGFFRSGDAKLLPVAVDKLLRIGEVLRQRNADLRVEGHSDDQPIHSGIYRSNWELSTARAMSVVSMLVDRGVFPPEKISAAGYGPYRPVASNATREGRHQNRRIELVVSEPIVVHDNAK